MATAAGSLRQAEAYGLQWQRLWGTYHMELTEDAFDLAYVGIRVGQVGSRAFIRQSITLNRLGH